MMRLDTLPKDGSKSSLTVIQNRNVLLGRGNSVQTNFCSKSVSHSSMLPHIYGRNPNSKLFSGSQTRLSYSHIPLKERVIKQEPDSQSIFSKFDLNKIACSSNSSSENRNQNLNQGPSIFPRKSVLPSKRVVISTSNEVRTSSPRTDHIDRLKLLKEAPVSPIRSPKRPLSHKQYENSPKRVRLTNFPPTTTLHNKTAAIVSSEPTVDIELSVLKAEPIVEAVDEEASAGIKIEPEQFDDFHITSHNNCYPPETDISPSLSSEPPHDPKGALWHLISDSNLPPQFKQQAQVPVEQFDHFDVKDQSDHVEMTPTKSLSEADQHSFHLTSPPAICSHLPSHILHRKLNKKSAFAKLKFASQKAPAKPLFKSLLKHPSKTRYVSDSMKLVAEEAKRTAVKISESTKSVSKFSKEYLESMRDTSTTRYNSQNTRRSLPTHRSTQRTKSNPFKRSSISDRAAKPSSPPPAATKEESPNTVNDSVNYILNLAYDNDWQKYAYSQSSEYEEMVLEAREFLESYNCENELKD